MAKKNYSWKPGDIFGIPLNDGKYALGQVISSEKNCMDSVLCAFTKTIVDEDYLENCKINFNDLVSVQITTRDSLDKGIWPIFNSGEPLSVDEIFPIKSIRAAEYVGAKIRGSGSLHKFLSAFHGLSPWDEYADPNYFDKLLLQNVRRPQNVIFKELRP